MSLEKGIYDRLSTDSTLSAYFTDVKTQIGNRPLGEKAVFPYLQFKKLDSPLYDNKPERWERWRFIVTDSDFFDCGEIRDLVAGLFLKGYGDLDDVTVFNAQVINAGSDPVFNTEISAYQVLDLDIRFSYYI